MNNDDDAKIINSKFLTSFSTFKEDSSLSLPEVAFVGRSNVGKSSLINALCNHKKLAITSKTPGRTRLLNYFHITLRKIDNDKVCHLVDLPGYGYSSVSSKMKKVWEKEISSYLLENSNLKSILVLHDIRRKITDDELWFFSLDTTYKKLLILTKSDKLSNNQISKAKIEIEKTIIDHKIDKIIISSSNNKKGLTDIRNHIFDLSYDKDTQ